MGEIDPNLIMCRKIPSSSDLLKRTQKGKNIIELSLNRNIPGMQSRPTNLLQYNLDTLWKTY